MRRRQSLSKCVALCAFIITHLAAGAAAAPRGTPEFINLGTIVRHQFYPTCDFLQIFHSKVQLAIQGLPFEFRAPAASTCAKIRSEHECARVNAMAVGTAL